MSATRSIILKIFTIYQSTIGSNNGAMIAKKDIVHVVSYVCSNAYIVTSLTIFCKGYLSFR